MDWTWKQKLKDKIKMLQKIKYTIYYYVYNILEWYSD
jgi:hypothetical protein